MLSEGVSLITDKHLMPAPDLICTDVISTPEETASLSWPREAGCSHCMNGTGMVLYQGAASFKPLDREWICPLDAGEGAS